ncbi:MAG: ABC transporter substrate-binding protein [Alphaproteobacteria bacterium]
MKTNTMKKPASSFRVGILAGAAALALSAALPAAAQDTVTIVSWGGAYSESQRKAYYEPYMAATGIKIVEAEYTGDIAQMRAMVESGNVTWDVIDVDASTSMAGCDQAFLEELDYDKIGQPRDKFVVGGANDCGVATIVYSTIYGYDAGNPPAEWNGKVPTTVADFFDLATFPGKRGLYKKPFVNLEWALIADGVAKEDVYDVLRTPEGVDRAFAKLDAIKADSAWWEAGAQAPELLANGEVVMVQAWNGRLYGAVKNEGKQFVIIWDHQAVDFDFWAIMKNTPKLDAAYAFLAYASDPVNMARQSQFIAYGPSHADAIPLIPEDVLKDLPTFPGNMTTAFTVDPTFWADNSEALQERFNAWLAQ